MRKVFASLLFLFYASFAWGYITDDVPNGCLYSGNIRGVFEPNVHTCAAGYYLPANYDSCIQCAVDATCAGGTFTFNERVAQGIVYHPPISHNLPHGCAANAPLGYSTAVFERNQHTCAAGQYMPANYDGCQICPENNYCPGGTYTFNETTASGATPCPAGTVAPPGMSSVEQCGRKLHLGPDVLYLRSQRRTNPSLNFDTDGDGVADFFANVTTTDTIMSATATQKFKIKVGETIYSICDDTVMP